MSNSEGQEQNKASEVTTAKKAVLYDFRVPKKFTKELAEEMVICLGINNAFAVVVYSQYELTGQPFVKHTK